MFEDAFDEYIEGDWVKARDKLLQVEAVKGSIDYPTRNLIAFMGENNYRAPDDWEGCRALTEK